MYYNTSTSSILQLTQPELIDVNEKTDSIELIYRQYEKYNISNGIEQLPAQVPIIYKIVYSVVNGKWNKSEPIYGKFVPAQKETYQF
jgi:hypothetical protein